MDNRALTKRAGFFLISLLFCGPVWATAIADVIPGTIQRHLATTTVHYAEHEVDNHMGHVIAATLAFDLTGLDKASQLQAWDAHNASWVTLKELDSHAHEQRAITAMLEGWQLQQLNESGVARFRLSNRDNQPLSSLPWSRLDIEYIPNQSSNRPPMALLLAICSVGLLAPLYRKLLKELLQPHRSF